MSVPAPCLRVWMLVLLVLHTSGGGYLLAFSASCEAWLMCAASTINAGCSACVTRALKSFHLEDATQGREVDVDLLLGTGTFVARYALETTPLPVSLRIAISHIKVQVPRGQRGIERHHR